MYKHVIDFICDGGSSVLATAVVRMSACPEEMAYNRSYLQKQLGLVLLYLHSVSLLSKLSFLFFQLVFHPSQVFHCWTMSGMPPICLFSGNPHEQEYMDSKQSRLCQKGRPKSLAGIVTGACWVLNRMVPLASLSKPDRKGFGINRCFKICRQ